MGLIPRKAIYPNPESLRKELANEVGDVATEAIISYLKSVLRELSRQNDQIYLALQGTQFTAREGTLTAFDYDTANLTADANFHELSFTHIVPSGARAILFRLQIADDTVAAIFRIRPQGSNDTYKMTAFRTQVANVAIDASAIVPCDANRIVEYYAANVTWSYIYICVLGWWI